MGIKGLKKLMRDVGCRQHQIPMSDFAYRRIAVDASPYMFKYSMVSTNGSVVDSYVEMVVRLREHKIHPVFVFDGTSPPEKDKEKQKRRDDRQKQIERVERIEVEMTEEIPSEFLKQIYSRHLKGPTMLVELEYDSEAMTDYVQKLKTRMTMNVEERLLVGTLDAMGVPHVRASGEAEMTCAFLCKKGVVSAVMTTDSDILAARCPVVINDMKNGMFSCTYFDDVLVDLNLTADQFTDLCIMCGTDFNCNVTRIGPKKSLDLIRKHSKIENVPITGKEILNHIRVRQLLEGIDDSNDILSQASRFNTPIRYSRLNTWLLKTGARSSTESIRSRVG
jgi:5'-3' exonuclease